MPTNPASPPFLSWDIQTSHTSPEAWLPPKSPQTRTHLPQLVSSFPFHPVKIPRSRRPEPTFPSFPTFILHAPNDLACASCKVQQKCGGASLDRRSFVVFGEQHPCDTRLGKLTPQLKTSTRECFIFQPKSAASQSLFVTSVSLNLKAHQETQF